MCLYMILIDMLNIIYYMNVIAYDIVELYMIWYAIDIEMIYMIVEEAFWLLLFSKIKRFEGTI